MCIHPENCHNPNKDIYEVPASSQETCLDDSPTKGDVVCFHHNHYMIFWNGCSESELSYSLDTCNSTSDLDFWAICPDGYPTKYDVGYVHHNYCMIC
jgi:hypothetical protein